MQENHQKQIQRLQSQINGCSETEENLVKLVPMEFAEEIEQLKVFLNFDKFCLFAFNCVSTFQMNLKLTSSKLVSYWSRVPSVLSFFAWFLANE